MPPKVTDNPWMAAMRRGDFEAAWRFSDDYLRARLRGGTPQHTGPRHLQQIWNGSTLAGKRVLVRCYHGLGDTVQFIRFAPRLRQIATHVTIWVQPNLLELIRECEGVDVALPLHAGVPGGEYDVDIEIMELAYALRASMRTISVGMPYLFVPDDGAVLPPKAANEALIGVVWQVGDWAPERSMNPQLLSPVAQVPGIRLCSLQCGPAAAFARGIPAEPIGCEDVRQTLAMLRGLDLLITVDTFIAHLGGAIGIPVWLLLHAHCDWRWMQGRSDSPWYPTMRLFRQPRPGDWQSVIKEVIAALVHARVGHRTFGTNRSDLTFGSRQVLTFLEEEAH